MAPLQPCLQLAASGWVGGQPSGGKGGGQQANPSFGAKDVPRLKQVVATFEALGDQRQAKIYCDAVSQLEAANRPLSPPTVGAAKHAVEQARHYLTKAVLAAERLEAQLREAKQKAV